MDNLARVGNVIDISAMVTPKKKHKKVDRCSITILSPEEYGFVKHSADYIESKNNINDLILNMYERGRIDTMVFFVVAINIGYRPVDILSWRWCQIRKNETIMSKFIMPEHKTGKSAFVELNDSAMKILNWYYKYKVHTEKNFNDDGFVFSATNIRQKRYVYHDVNSDLFWHHKQKKDREMSTYVDGELVTQNADIIINAPERFIKMQKAIDLDTISKHFIEASKDIGMDGHFSSYTTRQSFSYWFDETIATDDEFADLARRTQSRGLLSRYFNHSNMRITNDHYRKYESKLISKVVSKMNLGIEAVDLITE